jgi:ubiquinone/menaquinone biosynthesis C-methylase UbiE
MELEKLKQNWETFAQTDPMWAILTVPEKTGKRWSAEDFFLSGETEINRVLRDAEGFGFTCARRTALDFGCGVGRLTQALCGHFERCYGIDIAPTMISEAKKFNRHSDRCTYLQNDRSDLALFQDNSFDFIYTNIVLQHMRPEYSKAYLKEFLRVLSPGGLLVFQLPSRMRGPADSSVPRSAAAGPLPQSAFRAAYTSPSNSVRVLPGQRFTIPVTATNQSAVLWPALGTADGSFQVFVGNHWLSSEGKMIIFDDGRCALPHDVNPGQSFDIEFTLVAPEVPGDYVLEFDVGQERVTWFKEWGSPTSRVQVEVYVSRRPLSKRYPRLHAAAKTRHLLRLWRWLNGNSPIPVVSPPPQPVMEMYGTLPREVTDWVEKCGGKVLCVEDDYSAGPNWCSQRYWATKTG